MRLIDADKLMKELTGYRYDTGTPEARRAAHDTQALYQEIVQRQPTAYDVDKVVGRLKKEKSGLTTWAEDEAYKLGIEKAIEIIKSSALESAKTPNCDKCKCRNCYNKAECCTECEGSILECEKYSEIRPDE